MDYKSAAMRAASRRDDIPEGYDVGSINQYDRNQTKLYEGMFGNVGKDSYLSKLAGGDEATYREMEAPAMKQFNQLQGGLASRFSNMGMGARRSSGFQNTSTQASSDFASQLKSQRNDLRMKAIKDLQEMSSQLLDKRPREKFLVGGEEETKKPLGGWGGTIGAIGGGIAGTYMGGNTMAGAAIGSQALSGL